MKIQRLNKKILIILVSVLIIALITLVLLFVIKSVKLNKDAYFYSEAMCNPENAQNLEMKIEAQRIGIDYIGNSKFSEKVRDRCIKYLTGLSIKNLEDALKKLNNTLKR